jgi:hypothetical protein
MAFKDNWFSSLPIKANKIKQCREEEIAKHM